MRDLSEFSAEPAIRASLKARRKSRTTLSRRATLCFAAMGAVVICGVHAAVAGANTIPASGMGYLCIALVFLGCSIAFWTRARAAEGSLFIRWSMVSAAALAASIGYFPSFTQAVFDTPPARQLQTACFNASEALYMLAVVFFFAGVSRYIVIVDALQALLFVVLRFNLMYSPVTRDHFTTNHLLVGQVMALCLFLVTLVGCFGAASNVELRFLRTLACFFGFRLVAYFLANQVSYSWMHYENCSLWDVPGQVLLAGFAVYLIYTRDNAEDFSVSSPCPSMSVRNLMPSFLALVNLMLALFLLPISFPMAAGAIMISVICYVARTALFQAEAEQQKARLESRNEHLEELAVQDPLTGIGNRRSLANVYGKLQSAGGGEQLSILLMDIDYFKQANDRHGHLHGDQVLVTLARKLDRLAVAVKGSHCARFGGDEFALLLVGISPENAAALAEELRARFSARAVAPDGQAVSLSIGIASLKTANDLPLETLIDWADKALYRAKMLGRNRVEVERSHADGTRREIAMALP
ncbi:MAG TPA: GGDEF domain-containing protein [Terracidiphilus sp.]|jgi:diguanylate cyclase (GGDEF)-like protein